MNQTKPNPLHIDAFKCFACNSFFDGTHVGTTTVFPYRKPAQMFIACANCRRAKIIYSEFISRNVSLETFAEQLKISLPETEDLLVSGRRVFAAESNL